MKCNRKNFIILISVILSIGTDVYNATNNITELIKSFIYTYRCLSCCLQKKKKRGNIKNDLIKKLLLQKIITKDLMD